MRKRFLLSSLVALALGITSVNAQLYNYTNDLSGSPASVAANTSASSLGRVNGALASAGCADGFNSNKFSEGTVYATTKPAMEFSITANSGYQLDVTSLSVDARHNNKGPVTWRLAYSTDGGATWVDNGADYNVGAISCGTSTTLSWDMADFSTYNTLYVRVYAYAALSNLNGVATAKNVVLGGSVSFADVDGDGYTSDVDCNDADAAINPGASESCNGIDDNCDGNIDEGVQTTYYADMDGDTYGDAGNTTMACSMPEGYVADATDCNDADAAVNPAATEVCNGIDDNCDGNNDEGLTFTTYYADADGDTYGDAGSTVSTCDGAPEGYVSDATDCNDADAAVNPGATEICNGIDDNCDGNIDEGVQNTYYADMDGDTYGDASSTTMACSAPEGYVSDATDCNDADGAVNPGATEVCNGIDDNCDGNTDEGVQNTYYADADGDTYGDAGSTTMACSAPEGYVADATDCNDADGAVNPGATEVCNGIDDNCDGNTDEGVENTYYADADGDTYGDAGSTTMACSAPEGYVSDATDCNDADGAVNPGATEVCNGIDDNCDGNTDEGVQNTYYADADGDTYGDAGSTTMACSAPEGYVSDATDCNDADGAVNPGATEVCNGIDDNCDGNIDEGLTFTTYYADADGDTYGDAASTVTTCDGAPEGYVSDATDCNDADGAVNPGATEVCNGIDDNCDGNIDEGVQTTYYADADGDTYGDAGSTTMACSAPEGYVSDATDCNDADGAVNPGATEVCNGIDDNCDGNTDEGVQNTYYADADGDTYGDAGSTTMACSAPEGYVSDATDCNDADGAVNPGATEVCNGIDDNCDGNIDEGLTFTTYYADADGDTYGDAASTVTTCDGAPEGYVSDATDCNDADGAVNPGATEVCNGIDDNCDGNIDEGVQTTYYADADGDTYGDAGSTTMACSAPEGYVADATDCNDADGAVNPGATEVCNGIDDNCDGNTDEGVQNTYYADADGDTHGDAAASVEACSAPEGYVASNDDCNDASSTVYPGAPEICNNGIDEDCDGGIDVISTIAAGGPTTFCLGNSVTLSSTTVGTGYGYQWMKNGSNIAGANSSSLNVTLQGNYKCTVTKGDCSSTSSVITVSVNLNPNATIVALDGTDLCGKSYVRLKANNGTGLTYQWYMDGVIIDGATGNVYYASLPGDYYVVVTNAAGCSKQTATVTVVSSCRIAEEGAVAFNVMPNPSNGNFQLNVNLGNGLNGNAIISVVNIAGQKVAQLNGEIANGEMSASVSIPQVAGVYMVVVEANGEVFSQQILITE